MPEARTPVALTSIPEDILDALSNILDRAVRTSAAAAGPVERQRLESDLLDVVHAAGVAHDGSVAGELWHELVEVPDHKALALGYRRVAAADARSCPMTWCSWRGQRSSGMAGLISPPLLAGR